MPKYEIIYDEYSRYGGGGMKRREYHAEDDTDALLKANAHLGYPYSDSMGRDYGDEGFVRPSFDKILERILEQNGDGCSYIIQLQNLDTNNYLIDEPNYTFEDDGEEW